MFWRNKEKRKSLCKVKQQDSKYFWVDESDFIRIMIYVLSLYQDILFRRDIGKSR